MAQKYASPRVIRQREEVVKIKHKRHAPPAYGILNALFSTFLFLIIYLAQIQKMPHDLIQFGYIFLANIVIGILSSLIARGAAEYGDEMMKSGAQIQRTLISNFIYSIIVFFGLYQYIFSKYINPATMTIADLVVFIFTWDFVEVLLILMAAKIVVYLLSNVAENSMHGS